MELTANCSLARAYVTHSNAHDLDAIRGLLDADARYESAHAGVLTDRESILHMMADFFARFEDVHWDANCFAEVAPRRVAFDFRMRATDADGNPIQREGREIIEFTPKGLIASVRVGGRESAPQG